MRIVSGADVVYEDQSRRERAPGAQGSGTGGKIGHAGYFGHVSKLERGPQAFYADWGPNARIAPHFHRVDQFQIFTRGSATVGKHSLEPCTVHYADSYTPYGPIVGGEEGFAFYNLRAQADTGALFMPGSDKEMVRRAGRQVTAHGRLAGPVAEGVVRTESLIPLHDDGLAAIEILAGPNATLAADVAGGGCRYELVLEGSLELAGRTLGEKSVIVVNAGETLAERRAGPEGVHVLHLQLPHP